LAQSPSGHACVLHASLSSVPGGEQQGASSGLLMTSPMFRLLEQLCEADYDPMRFQELQEDFWCESWDDLDADIDRHFMLEDADTAQTCEYAAQRTRITDWLLVHSEIPVKDVIIKGPRSGASTWRYWEVDSVYECDCTLLCDRDWFRSRGAAASFDFTSSLQLWIDSVRLADDESCIKEFKVSERRCGAELEMISKSKLAPSALICYVLGYLATSDDGADEAGSLVVYDNCLGQWQTSSPEKVALVLQNTALMHPHLLLVMRMLTLWKEYCPRVRTDWRGKGNHPITELHLQMALCLQHKGFQDTCWAHELMDAGQHIGEPHRLDSLIAATEHLIATLDIPIETPGVPADAMHANEYMLYDSGLVKSTRDLLEQLLLTLCHLKWNPSCGFKYLKFALRGEAWTVEEARRYVAKV